METYFADFRGENRIAWHSHYSLWIEIGWMGDDQFKKTCTALWTHPSVEGCYVSLDTEPSAQLQISPLEVWGYDPYGLITLPNGARVACTTDLFPEEHTSWYQFYMQIGPIAKAYDVEFNVFLADTECWRKPLDDLLVDIARRVFATQPFLGAHVGPDHRVVLEEASEITQTGIPEQRVTGYLWPTEKGLEWHPPTEYGRLELISW